MTLSSIAGCATMDNGVATQDYNIERIITEHVMIENVRLHNVSGGIRIDGELRPRGWRKIASTGYINVEIIDQKDGVVEEVSNHYHRGSKINRPNPWYKFSVTIPVIPPAGSAIRIKYVENL